MFPRWSVPILVVIALLFGAACDKKPQPPPVGASSATATPAAQSAVAPAPTPVASVTAVPSSSAAEEEPPPPPAPVAKIRVQNPQGIEFVSHKKWRQIDPLPNRLNGLTHAENRPIMDIVIMHSAQVTTEDNELAVLQNMQTRDINVRKWADIAAHYFVGPSGKVYQGRLLRYRYPDGAGASIGSGMGRLKFHWNKCAIMLLGNFTSQEITPEAKEATIALIDDRRGKFDILYEEELKAREAETVSLMGANHVEGRNYGYDVTRVMRHPSLPASVWAVISSAGADAP